MYISPPGSEAGEDGGAVGEPIGTSAGAAQAWRSTLERTGVTEWMPWVAS